jgi:F-type H+-transporting ATPase subunit gamma
VTQHRILEDRLASLSDSGEIIRSMKNLAFMETRKLTRLIEHQRGVVAQIDAVAADFLAFFPHTLPPAASSHRAYLVIGSRRGFCGDFNERLVARLRQEVADSSASGVTIIGVGHKLCRRLQPGLDLAVGIDGADVAEEIASVLAAIVDQLDAQRKLHDTLHLNVLYQSPASHEPSVLEMLPPFEAHRGGPRKYPNAPLLNLSPRTFLLELGGQYLFAALHTVLFESLLAENERRLRHLDGAVRHLEKRAEEIRRRVQALRQEEIIEEIEVILLNAAQVDDGADTPDSP